MELKEIEKKINDLEKEILILKNDMISHHEFNEFKDRIFTVEKDHINIKNSVANLGEIVMRTENTAKDTNRKVDKIMEITMKQQTKIDMNDEKTSKSEKRWDYISKTIMGVIILALLGTIIIK